MLPSPTPEWLFLGNRIHAPQWLSSIQTNILHSLHRHSVYNRMAGSCVFFAITSKLFRYFCNSDKDLQTWSSPTQYVQSLENTKISYHDKGSGLPLLQFCQRPVKMDPILKLAINILHCYLGVVKPVHLYNATPKKLRSMKFVCRSVWHAFPVQRNTNGLGEKWANMQNNNGYTQHVRALLVHYLLWRHQSDYWAPDNCLIGALQVHHNCQVAHLDL